MEKLSLPKTQDEFRKLEQKLRHVESEGIDSGAKDELMVLLSDDFSLITKSLWWWNLSARWPIEYFDTNDRLHSFPNPPEEMKSEIQESLWSMMAEETDDVTHDCVKELFNADMISVHGIIDFSDFLDDEVGHRNYRNPENGELKVSARHASYVRPDGKKMLSAQRVSYEVERTLSEIDGLSDDFDNATIEAVIGVLRERAASMGVDIEKF